MSRIGKKPIAIPAGVTVTINGQDITVKGPKGELSFNFRPEITVAVEGSEIIVTRANDQKEIAKLFRRTINNDREEGF